MAQKRTTEDLEVIAELLQSFEDGASLSDLIAALHQNVPKRTLQRHLALLVKNGTVLEKGRARARRYFLTKQMPSTQGAAGPPIPLSEEGFFVQSHVSKPIQMRRPVGYNRAFLDGYLPNETFYLSQVTRDYLSRKGKIPDGNRPAGSYARLIFNRLLIDLSWNSSRLEGNTYSLLETKRLLEFGESSEGKDVTEAQMILNHKAAIEFLVDSAAAIDINKITILNLHALLSNNLLSNPASSGRLRTIPVGIAKSVYKPMEIPQMVQECFLQLLTIARTIRDPFEQAFFIMAQLPYLQPFEDVNKRVSRLAANIPLIRENFCPLSFVDVPEDLYTSSMLGVYELNDVSLLRDLFVWAYERSCLLYSATSSAVGEPDLFRFRYRNELFDAISHIVSKHLNAQESTQYTEERAKAAIPPQDQARFISVVDTELANLHEGNIARYRIRLSDFEAWSSTTV